ncbi:MAG: hypothetical protein ACT4N2_11130, partial [Hyphomicrobium sp.]
MRMRSETKPSAGSVERSAGRKPDSASAGLVPSGLDGLDGVPATVTDIGQLFRELRRCLRSSLPELARRLETRIDVIEAL